jgi:hypothetical protein
MNWLRRHFGRHEQRTPGAYLWWVTLEAFLVAGMVGFAAAMFGAPSRDIKASQLPMFLLSAVACAPVLETLIFQMLPVLVARACGASRRVQIAASMLLFAVPHFVASPLTGLTAGLIGGFYFAFTFTHWQRRSLGSAFGMTFAQHTLYNAAVVLVVGAALLFE